MDHYHALKMTPANIGDVDYLIIENGNFSKRDKAGWKPEMVVFTRPDAESGEVPDWSSFPLALAREMIQIN